jgi:hypothetical protein
LSVRLYAILKFRVILIPLPEQPNIRIGSHVHLLLLSKGIQGLFLCGMEYFSNILNRLVIVGVA